MRYSYFCHYSVSYFFLKDNVLKSSRQFLVSILLSSTISLILFVLFFSLLVSLRGEVEVNPGPNRKPNQVLSICHWKLNSISADNFAKMFLLKAYVTVHKFDMLYLSEAYLYSSVPFDDNNLEISGYNLIRSDHPSKSKCGGVCIYLQQFSFFKSLQYKSFGQMYKFRVKNR